MRKLLFFLLFVVVSATLAEDPTFARPQSIVVESPENIVINPEPSYSIDLWLNKRSSDGSPVKYRIGEKISLGVKVTESAYVYIFSLHADGKVDQIFPNRFDSNNILHPNQPKYFGTGSKFTFRVAGPTGLDKVIAVASKSPLDTSTLANFKSERDFFAAGEHRSQESFARSLSIVVEPTPQHDWITDTEKFRIRY